MVEDGRTVRQYHDAPPQTGRDLVPVLLGHCLHKDRRIAQDAREVVKAWGEGALPVVVAAARRARPDRRGDYEMLAEALRGAGA